MFVSRVWRLTGNPAVERCGYSLCSQFMSINIGLGLGDCKVRTHLVLKTLLVQESLRLLDG